MSRPTYSGCLEQLVFCDTCDPSGDVVYANRKNGLAWAAQHYDRTGHTVSVEITNVVRYGERP